MNPRPLTPAEAADLARIVGHPRFHLISHVPRDRTWSVLWRDTLAISQARTLRACIRAAVRWIEEQEGKR